MIQHYIFLILFVLFINNVSSAIYNSETAGESDVTTNLTNVINDIKNNLQDEQTKTSTELYNGENLGKITASGSYHYSGELTNTITIQKNSGIVHLYFENAIFNIPDVKIVDSKNGVDLIITLIGENKISNQGETASNVISANQDITINGPGFLNIISSKNGIKCDGRFFGLGGILNITAKNHAISVDSLYLDGININVEGTGDGKDGFHAESDYDGVSEVPSFDFLKGFVYIQNGTFNIKNCKGDGIQADSFVYIAGGNISIETEAIWETFVATSNGMKGCFSKSGEVYTKVPSDNVRKGRTYYILSNSCKGIKVGEIDYYLKDDETETEQEVSSSLYTALIEGGTIEISSPDDSIHTNSGSALIYGGQIKISTLDDGITADLHLLVKDGDIDIQASFEGLEAELIEIEGGTIKIVSDDDGINAAGGSEPQIIFSGGKTYVYAKGDGIDSNGNLIINDGEVYVLQEGGYNGALDSDGDIIVNGGTLVAVGSSGMPEVPSSSSSQCVIVRKIASTTDDISLKSTNNDDLLLDFKISLIFGVKVSYALATLSSSSIQRCTSYDIVTGSSINTVVTSGSSSVTSNVRPGWGGGGGTTNNDGQNCPQNVHSRSPTLTSNTRTSSVRSPTVTCSFDESHNLPNIESSVENSGVRPTFGSEDHDDDDSKQNDKKGKGLSTGGIIGIAVACFIVVVLVVSLLVYFLTIRKKKNLPSSNEEDL